MSGETEHDWDEEVERSPSGQPIHRYEQRTRDFEPAFGDGTLIEAMDRHLDAIFPGVPRSVLHELVSDLVHLNVHVVAPTAERPFHTLVTSGMAERPMSQPEGVEGCGFAELTLSLPEGWPGFGEGETRLTTDDDHPWRDLDAYWPIGALKYLARFPHEYETWIWAGHTVPNGDPAEPLAEGTGLAGWMLWPSEIAGEGFQGFSIGDRDVMLLALWPLHPAEMDFKLRYGAEALVERLAAAGHTTLETIDPQRPCVDVSPPRRRKWWWPFG